MKTLVLMIVLVTYTNSINLFSQSGSISGSVRDSLTNTPIDYATLTLLKKSDSSVVSGTLSKDNGKFVIQNIPFGIYDLKATFMGFNKTYIRNIKIDNSSTNINLGNIALLPASIETDEVSVTADKELVTYTLDKQIVNVSKHINAKGGMAANVLENIPSVQVDAEGNVSLRGSQNFTVLIDGRPSILSAQDALKQIPAEMLENIEIITNPSAKYDPEGTSGIINLVMKKQSVVGDNGLISLTTGSLDKYNANLNYNFRNENYNLSSSFNFNDNKYHPSSDFTKQIQANNENIYSRTVMNRYMVSKGISGNLGIEYFLNPKSIISLTFATGDNSFERYFPGNFTEWTSTIENSSIINNLSYSKSNDAFELGGFWGSGELNYSLNLSEMKEHKINAFFKTSIWNGNIKQSHKQNLSDISFVEDLGFKAMHRLNNDANRNDINFGIDYTLPFSQNSKLELGTKIDFTNKNFDYIYEDFVIIDSSWKNNSNFSNNTEFSQNTNAIYSTYSNSIFGFDFMAGLRAEYYTRKLIQNTLDEKYPYDDFNLFPSLHITYSIIEGHNLQFSYSRRVERPDDRTLNPFPDYTDQNFVSQGNPKLNPEFTNSFELKYLLNEQSFYISLGTFYRYTSNLISQILIPYDSTRMLITTANLNEGYVLGEEIVINYNPFPWFRMNLSTNIYELYLRENIRNNTNLRNSTVFDMNGTLLFIFAPTTILQLTSNYSGEKISANGTQNPFYFVSATLKQDFLNKSLTMIINLRDIFGTAKYDLSNSVENFASYGYFKQEGPVIQLTISYKINNYQPKSKSGNDVNIDVNSGGI